MAFTVMFRKVWFFSGIGMRHRHLHCNKATRVPTHIGQADHWVHKVAFK